MSIKQIVARLNDKSLIAAEGDKSDVALKHFESLFGAGKRHQAGDVTTYTFKDMSAGDRKVTDISFDINGDDGYEFACRIHTGFIAMNAGRGMPYESVLVEHDTAAGILSEFKKHVGDLVKAQQKDIDEDNKNLAFLKKLER